MWLYNYFHEAFHWTRSQIDGEELEYLFLLMLERAEKEPEKLAYIDEVM